MSGERDQPSIEDFWLSLGLITGMLTRDDVRFNLSRRIHTDPRGRAYVRLLYEKLGALLRDAPP